MIRSAAVLTLCLVTVTAQAALLGRAALTPGGTDYQAYYDDVLDITWLADANYSKTSGFDADGVMSFIAAQSWISTLNQSAHLGIHDWRLPTVDPVDGSLAFNYLNKVDGSADFGFNISAPGSAFPGATGSEMAHLYYNTLGNLATYTASGTISGCYVAPGYCLTNSGPFSNIQLRSYWTNRQFAPYPADAFSFDFSDGLQVTSGSSARNAAWAVTDGDAFPVVPVPAPVWLFGSALGLMGWMRRRNDS